MAAFRSRVLEERSASERFRGALYEPGSARETPIVRVIVCHPQAPFRRGVAECLRAEGYVVDEAAAAAGLAPALALNAIGLIVVAGTAFDAFVASGARIPPTAKVVVVAESPDAVDALRVLERGAAAYLLEDAGATAFIRACRAVMKGREVVDESVSSHKEFQRRARRVGLTNGSHIVLSRREYEVAGRLKDGAPTREIADELGISVVTVRRHISTTMDKVGVASRESLRYALLRS